MTERRRDKRVKEENRVVIEVSPAGGRGDALPINAFTKDISLSGVRIWTDRLFPLQSKLNLTLYLSRSKQVVRIRGTVKWEKECDDGLYEIGVHFQQGIPDVLMALINHLYGREEGIPTEVNRGRTT
jgi:c-di-GMP-binding flagellar brake protein YcgR